MNVSRGLGLQSTLVLFLTVAIVVVTYLPQIGAPLELQDDHRIIEPLITAHPPGPAGAVRLWCRALWLDVHQVGRFRPVSQVFDVVGPLALGPEALVWHSISLLLAACVSALLYLAAFRLWRSRWAAAVFALVTLLAPDPGPSAAWYRPGPKEAWAMLFLSMTLVVMVYAAGKRTVRSQILSFVLVTLTACCKESFLMLVPALFALEVWLEVRATGDTPRQVLRARAGTGILYGALFLCGLAAVAAAVRGAGAHSYGAHSLAMSPSGVLRVMLRDALRTPSLAVWFIPVLLALPLVKWRRERGEASLLAAVVFCAWIFPQFALHGTRGGFWDHYWLPCVVAFAAINAAGVSVLMRRSPFLLRSAAMVAIVVWLINAVRVDATAASNFKTKASVQQAAVAIAARNVRPGSDLVIVADADLESERAPSFADFVNVAGGHFRRALLYDSRCHSATCGFFDLRAHERLDSVDPSHVSVVTYLGENAGMRPLEAAWHSTAEFKHEAAAGTFRFLSLRSGTLVDIPFQIDVDVRNRPVGGS